MGLDLSRWDKRFLAIVDMITSWSKDPSTKCGALIVRPDRAVVSYGYNNFPAGIMDTAERLNDRPTKYELVVHAETNALLFTHESVEGYIMYVSAVPCCRCAMNIIQARIAKVICRPPTDDYLSRWSDSVDKTLSLFQEAGVMCYWE